MLKWVIAGVGVLVVALVLVVWLDPGLIDQITRSVSSSEQASPPKPAQSGSTPQPAPEAANASAAPQKVEITTYDSWTVTCRDTAVKSSRKNCAATLQVMEEKQRQVLLTWTIGRDDKGTLVSVLQTPTNVRVQNGVELKLGEQAPRKLDFVVCDPQFCQATIAMDSVMLKDAAAATSATATIRVIDGRDVNFNFATKGIFNALAALGP